MTIIHLQTIISAPREKVFALARSIDLHLESTAKTNEKAIAGVTSGLIGLGESVTWRESILVFIKTLLLKLRTMIIPILLLTRCKKEHLNLLSICINLKTLKEKQQ